MYASLVLSDATTQLNNKMETRKPAPPTSTKSRLLDSKFSIHPCSPKYSEAMPSNLPRLPLPDSVVCAVPSPPSRRSLALLSLVLGPVPLLELMLVHALAA